MAYTHLGLAFDRPYEAIMHWLQQRLRGNKFANGKFKLEDGSITISGNIMYVIGQNLQELKAIERIFDQQNAFTEKFKTFNKLECRIASPIPVTETVPRYLWKPLRR
jgi:hypothetical protein